MTETKEADLVTAVMLYAIRCLAEGDLHALRAMRFGPKEIDALRALTLADLYRIGSLNSHCLAIRLNRDVFWPMMSNLCASRETEDLQRDLIQADAPLEMMRRLFGLGSREYSRLRRVLALAPAVGRPPELDQVSSERLWEALSPHLQSASGEGLDAEHYLSVHEASGASLRAIWNVVQRWTDYGDVDVPSDSPLTSPAAGTGSETE